MIEEEKGKSGGMSLECLLQAKRCERPSEDFWNDFEKELKKKTLQSIVSKRPWRERVLELFIDGLKPILTVSGVAVFTLCLVFSGSESEIEFSGNMVASVEDSDRNVNFSEVLAAGQRSFSTEVIAFEPSGAKKFNKVFATRSVESVGRNGVQYVTSNFNNSGLATAMAQNSLF